jgi:hypothetical protein
MSEPIFRKKTQFEPPKQTNQKKKSSRNLPAHPQPQNLPLQQEK